MIEDEVDGYFNHMNQENMNRSIKTFKSFYLMDQDYVLQSAMIYLSNGNLFFRETSFKSSSLTKSTPTQMEFSQEDLLFPCKKYYF